MRALKKCGNALAVGPVWAALVLWALSAIAHSAVVLQYHHVSEDTPASTSISPELFRKHMNHVERAGYSVLPLEELVGRLRKGEALPDKAVAITFDDGYDSIYTEAFPILRRRGWPFTVFVTTKPLQQGIDQFVNWDNLREMADAGATIANHSYSHPHLQRRQAGESDQAWRQRIKDEVLGAEKTIAEQTGQSHRILAYPYGEYDLATKALLAELDFVAFGQQSGPLDSNDDLQALPRFPFGGIYGGMEDFKVKIASLPMPLDKIEVRDDGERIADTVLPQSAERPRLILTLARDGLARGIQCFASGQGAIPLEVEDRRVVAHAKSPLPVGRSRYNCTAMSDQSGRFYWYSHFFMRKKPNGEWYGEP